MALSRIHPAAADTGGHHHPPLYHHNTTAADHNPYPPYRRKHRPFPTTDADADADTGPPSKRRKPTAPGSWMQDAEKWSRYPVADAPSTSSSVPLPPSASRSEEEAAFMSRAEIERCSPSRKDGIDSLLEAQLRYSYCAYLQSLGLRLQMPQTTIGTAMVLCHRFFVRRSHACHDRFLVATAALFLASKSEETPCLLNTVLRTSCEVCQAENLAFHPYLLSNQDWFEQYRERVTEAEQMILTTLDFELDVHHPYVPLATVLNKFGLSQTALLNLAWNFVTEGLRTSLWLQFKPNQIAAGAVFLAAKFLSFDLAFYPSIWHEFHTTPWVLQEVVQQLMEIF